MKYFFLSESWTTGRVWEFGGLWNELAWHRTPHLSKRSLCITEHGETLCLYEAEESILMVEVIPKSIASNTSDPAIGQVVLKRLLSAEQAIERLCQEDNIFQQSKCHSDDTSDTSTVTAQLAEHPTTDTISTGSSNFDHRDNRPALGNPKQRQPSTETDETSPTLKTRTMATSRVNQEPVAINDYSEQD